MGKLIPLDVIWLNHEQQFLYDACVERRQRSTGQCAQDARRDVATWALKLALRIIDQAGNSRDGRGVYEIHV